jgi:phage-related protein
MVTYMLPFTMMKWKVEFHKTKSGKEPVRVFIKSLSKKEIAKTLREIELLEDKGIRLGFPHTSSISGTKGLRELRIKFSSNQIRIFYFLHIGSTFILLHGFRKKQGPIPRKEIEVALERMKEYQ